MSQTIRFFTLNTDGTEKANLGTATLTDTGIDYENAVVRQAMAGMVHMVGMKKAFAFYNPWTNGRVASEAVQPAT